MWMFIFETEYQTEIMLMCKKCLQQYSGTLETLQQIKQASSQHKCNRQLTCKSTDFNNG